MKGVLSALCLVISASLGGLAMELPARAEDAKPNAQRRAKPAHVSKRGKKRAREAAPRESASRERPRESAGKGDRSREAEVTGAAASTASSAAAQAAQAAANGASGVDAEIVKEGDTSVKVMKFTGLGIEGRLKSPQLVYFVQRVRAEFERPTLPHRSFMPELARTTEREPVR